MEIVLSIHGNGFAGATRDREEKEFTQATTTNPDQTKRQRLVDVHEPAPVSMSTEMIKSLVQLLQETNNKNETLKEELRDLKRRYQKVEQELIGLKFALLCETFCKEAGEICKECSDKLSKVENEVKLWKKY